MRADRLLSLLMVLQIKGRATAQELAERLEVSERTIYRDIEALSIAGIPVYAERGPGGGCVLADRVIPYACCKGTSKETLGLCLPRSQLASVLG